MSVILGIHPYSRAPWNLWSQRRGGRSPEWRPKHFKNEHVSKMRLSNWNSWYLTPLQWGFYWLLLMQYLNLSFFNAYLLAIGAVITNWINKPTLNSSSWRPLGNVCVYAEFQLVSVEDPGALASRQWWSTGTWVSGGRKQSQTQVISMKTGGREWKCCRVAGWSGFEHQLCNNYMLTPWSTQFLVYKMKIMPMGHSADCEFNFHPLLDFV